MKKLTLAALIALCSAPVLAQQGRIEEPVLLRQYRCAAQRDQSGQSQFFHVALPYRY